MKKITLAAAVLAVIGAAAGLARAEDMKLDFDGRNGAALISAQGLKAELAALNNPAGFTAPEAAAAPAQSVTQRELKITAIVKNAGKTRRETLTCQPGLGADKLSDCKKSDSAALTYEELNTLALRQYFSPQTLKFADLLNQTKHSYTNQSGPMTFSCHDTCANHDLVSIGFSTSFPFLEEFEVKCVEWTHECDCVAGC